MDTVYTREQQHAPVHHYTMVAALIMAAMVVVVVAAYFGVAGMGWFTVGSALFGLSLVVLILAVGLSYVLFTLHAALERNKTSDRPYGMVGILVLAGIAVVVALAYVGAISFTTLSASGALFGLAAIELVLVLGLCYLLLTIKASLASRDHDTRAYSWVGAALLVGVAVLAVLAYTGVITWGLFSVPSAFFGAGAAALVLAAGLSYVFFTMKDSMGELRYQRTHPTPAGIGAQPTPAGMAAGAGAGQPGTAFSTVTAPSMPSFAPTASAPAATAAVHAKPPVARDWMPLADRKGSHAARTRHTNVQEIEGIGETYSARLKDIGISTTGQLKQANPLTTAKALGVHAREVRDWQSMADLMEINGVGKQYSELLMRAGIHSVDELAGSDPAKVFAATEAIEKRNLEGTRRQARIQGTHLSEDRIRRWVEEANRIL